MEDRDVIDIYPAHPYAELFPLMGGTEFEELVEDVRVNGVADPIILFEGQILDGRNRYRAWQRLGSIPGTCRFEVYTGGNPLGFVMSKNLHRRHLSVSQRAIVAAQLPGLQHGGDRTQPPTSLTRDQRADMLNVGGSTVERAEGVVETGAPELVAAVKQGEIAVSAASDIATLPKEQQAKILASLARDDEGQITPEARKLVKELAKDIRQKEQDDKKARRVQREAELGQHQMALPARKFGVIYADPEWKFETYSETTGMDRSADNHYPTSVTEAIMARPVGEIAADDCVLFLWATAPMLQDAFRVLEAWGFTYKTNLVWDKKTIGTGYWFRGRHEHLLVATKGNVPCPAMGTQWESVLESVAGRHSEKPEAVLEMIEQYFPTLPKIELNRRGPPRLNWDAWGNEALVDPPTEVVQSEEQAPVIVAAAPEPEAVVGGEDDLAIPEFLRRDK